MASASSTHGSSKRTFEHKWVIKNWENVMESDTLFENTKTEVRCQEEELEYAKFMVGLKPSSDGQRNYIQFNWTLLQKHSVLQIVKADLLIEILNGLGVLWHQLQGQASLLIQETVDITDVSHLSLPLNWDFYLGTPMTDEKGSLVILLKITLTNLPALICHPKAKEFRQTLRDECSQNLAALLDDKLCSDIKIRTKDNVELYAHKAILRARCPIFASMLGSDFLERSTALVNVDDISAKTMKILLRYWYSGELIPTWFDDDIVVEFTYAAGKYQMSKVLEMLDEFLGLDLMAFHLSVELLQIVKNLSLKNAEARLLKQVVTKIGEATSGAQVLDLFSIEAETFDENSMTPKEILKAFDDILSEKNENHVFSHYIKLLALARKLEMKNVETKLLNSIIGEVNKIKSSDELFALFDEQNEIHENSTKGDLLVRVKHEVTIN